MLWRSHKIFLKLMPHHKNGCHGKPARNIPQAILYFLVWFWSSALFVPSIASSATLHFSSRLGKLMDTEIILLNNSLQINKILHHKWQNMFPSRIRSADIQKIHCHTYYIIVYTYLWQCWWSRGRCSLGQTSFPRSLQVHPSEFYHPVNNYSGIQN